MSDLFEKIMKFHPGNLDVYNEIKENISIMVPFVGAGFTQFVYGTWPEAVEKLAEKLGNVENRKTVFSLIEQGKMEDAAQCLEEFRGPANLARDIANYFSPNKFQRKSGELRQQAVYLLPLLFSGLVLTTNFDSGLENIYKQWNRDFYEILHPGHSEALKQLLRQKGDRSLFKFHGSVSGRNIEYKNIVFTSEQYKRHYGNGSPLVKDLKSCLRHKVLLFLGCSLKNDRTMDVLQDILKCEEQGEQGYYHYTIINCKESEGDAKVLELEKKHIRAILYEDNCHEAVKVILEHLLKETAPDAYKTFAFHIKENKTLNSSAILGFEEELLPFYGRRGELKELNSFLYAQGHFRWWAITGAGGSGKSRLAYEFQKQLPDGWDSHKLSQQNYKELSGLSNYFSRKTLVIADFVEEYTQELGVWMEQLAQGSSEFPVRLLLIGRENEEEDGASEWNLPLEFMFGNVHEKKTMEESEMRWFPGEPAICMPSMPMLLAGKEDGKFSWEQQLFREIYNKAIVRHACFRQKYLELAPLPDHELLLIIKECARILDSSNSVKHISDARILEEILRKLKEADPVLCRPLYAIIMTSVYMSGGEPTKWNRETVLGFIKEKELTRLEFRIRKITGQTRTDRRLFAACQYVLCVSTVVKGISAGKLREICPDVWEIIVEKSEYFESPMDLLYSLGIMSKGDILSAIRPDLVGEYFVFDWMTRQRDETIQSFLSAVWKIPRPVVLFFYRVLFGYGELCNESAEKWDVFLLNDICLSRDVATLYALFLTSAIGKCNLQGPCEKQICQMERLLTFYPDIMEILVAYANSMVNLISKQDVASSRKTVEQLKELASIHRDIPQVTIALAKGMVNLEENEELTNKQEIADYLEQLAGKYPDLPELIECYANSLVRVCAKQSGELLEKNLEKLEILSEKYSHVPEIVTMYAHGVYNSTVNQDRCTIERGVSKMGKLAVSYGNNSEVIIMYAMGLFNLSLTQQGQEVLDTVKRLETLHFSYPHIPKIAEHFAKILVNFSIGGSLQIKRRTVKQIERLDSVYPENSEVIKAFSYSLINLSGNKSADAQEIINPVKKLVSKYPGRIELILMLNKALFNVSRNQDVPKIQKILREQEKILASYPDTLDLMEFYAKTLHVAGYKLNLQNGSYDEYVTKMEELANTYPDMPVLMEVYTDFLANISATANWKKTKDIVSELEILASQFAENEKVKKAYIKSLINLCTKTDDYFETAKKLEELASVYPDEDTVIAAYAKSLHNLCFVQNTEEILETLNRLEELACTHKNLGDVLICFAYGLRTLTSMQNKTEARKNLDWLKKVIRYYPQSPKYQKELYDKLLGQLRDEIETRP